MKTPTKKAAPFLSPASPISPINGEENDLSILSNHTDVADQSSDSDVGIITEGVGNVSLLDEGEFSLSDWLNRTQNSFETEVAMESLELSTDSSVLWVSDLDLSYRNQQFDDIPIPSTQLHSQLASSGNTLKDTVKAKLPNHQRDALEDPKPNFLMVNVGYILSQPAKNGEKFVSFPVRVPGQNYYSVQTSWEQQKKSKGSAVKNLQKRHDCGKEHSPQAKGFSTVQKNGPSHYYDDVEGPTYDTKFHHSEQALYEYLIQQTVVNSLFKRIQEAGVPKGTEIHGIIIDMHSTRYVCGNCELGAQGMMSPEYKFLEYFAEKAKDYGYSYKPNEAEIAFRVTANRPDGVKGFKTARDHENAPEARILGHRPEESRNKTVYEQAITVSPLQQGESDLHRRTAFISSHVADDKRYTEAFDQTVVGEYTSMIAEGKARRQHIGLSPVEGDGASISESRSTQELEGFVALTAMNIRKEASTRVMAKKVHSECTSYEQRIVEAMKNHDAVKGK